MSQVFGQKIGGYNLLELLGEGGMAKVYSAFDDRMERTVAIKVILPNKQSSAMFLKRFIAEARSLAQLTHANIVKVLDYGEDNGQPYLVMEYIKCGTLKEIMDSPIHWKQAAAILAPVARALEYVHHQRIVHRDVKPANILIDENDQPMLSDFGVVKLFEGNDLLEATAAGVGIGTPDYMSPEQGKGKEVDFHADIYALGVVYFEMVTGQKPYTADTPMAVVIKHVTDSFPSPRRIQKNLPDFVEEVIFKAVKKNPADRYASMTEFAEALEELARSEAVNVKKIRRIVRGNKKSAAPKAALITAALLLVGLAAGAFYFKDAIREQLSNSPAAALAPAYFQATATQVIPTAVPVAVQIAPSATPQPSATPAATEPPAAADANPTETPPVVVNSNPGIALINTPLPANTGGAAIAYWGIGGINDVDWSPDGSQLMLASTNGVYIYDAKTLQRFSFINTTQWVKKVHYTRGSNHLFAGLHTGEVEEFDSPGADHFINSYAYQKPASERLSGANNSPLVTFAFSSDEKFMATGFENGAINVYDLSNQKPVLSIDNLFAISAIKFSMDNRFLYVSTNNSDVNIIDLANGKQLSNLSNVAGVSLLDVSSDGNYVLSGGAASSAFLWSAADERILMAFNQLGASVSSLAFSPDNQHVAVGMVDGRIRYYQIPDAAHMTAVQKPLFEVKEHNGAVTSLTFLPDGKSLASTSWQNSLVLLDTDQGTVINAIKEDTTPIARVQFSDDGKWLAAGNVKNLVSVWEVNQSRKAYSLDGYLPADTVFSPDNQYLLVAVDPKNSWENGTLKVVDLSSGKVIQELVGYKPGWKVRFSPDMSMLVAGDIVNAIVWDVSNWEQVRIIGGGTGMCKQYSSPEGALLAVILPSQIQFAMDPRLLSLCGNSPSKATYKYYFPETGNGLYEFKSNLPYLTMGLPELIKNVLAMSSSSETFISGLNSAGHTYYFSLKDGTDLYLGGANRMISTHMDNYQYTGAVLSKNTLVALGDRFGSIRLLFPQ